MKSLRVALAQINTTVGDIEGNVEKILRYLKSAEKESADIVVFPELCVTGYPPEDLILKPQFVRDNMRGRDRVMSAVGDVMAVVGFVDVNTHVYNAAAVMHRGTLVDCYHKMYLPNYGVFDEFRYFQAGRRYPVYRICGIHVGLSICEDMWYPEGPSHIQSLAGAELVININASPYSIGKWEVRERMLSTRALDNRVVVAYLNAVGGQDELIFDGHSLIFDQNGRLIVRGRQFEEELIIADIDVEGVFLNRLRDAKMRQEALGLRRDSVEVIAVDKRVSARQQVTSGVPGPPVPVHEGVFSALVLGVRDYVKKNGFGAVLVGLSGGVDSSIVACIAVDALGRENVRLVFMPSEFTSRESREDAAELSRNLGIELTELPISDLMRAYGVTLEEVFRGKPPDATEENIQARIRGNLLMALSNKFGWLVLTTGNKSEMSVGYATLYGDMAGGFAVIKDIPKTLVYELARWRNSRGGGRIIPERVLVKEPSAELKAGQKDTDCLPPYSVLDPILKAYIEDDKSFEEILMMGCERECVEKVLMMVDRSEYKRRQSPPGIKVTERAFGRDRRFPITNRYRSY